MILARLRARTQYQRSNRGNKSQFTAVTNSTAVENPRLFFFITGPVCRPGKYMQEYGRRYPDAGYGIPSSIREKVLAFLDSDLLDIVAAFERKYGE
jgi:hypothetical protein